MYLWSRRNRFVISESNWCVRANGWAVRSGSRRYFAAVSRLGDGVFWYGLMAGMIVLDGMQGLRASAHLAATVVIALTLYKLLKYWTRRPRPCVSEVRIRAWVAPLDEFSFPSDHTLHAVAFTLVALAHYPMLAWVLIPFTSSIAVSRMVLGLHYPSDVLAATAMGTGLAALSLWLVPGVSLFA